ncbi:MAG: integrase/recombinase XerD [Urechidicola sp.]|jgi:site-specific recombinase XerD
MASNACPKGLRHSFAIHCLEKGIQLNMVSKWMGHSSLNVTAIYTNTLGEEERKVVSRIWE